MASESNPHGKWRVWQWGVESHLGSHGQRKLSTQTVRSGFDTEAEARAWSATQDTTGWRNWAVAEMGGNVVVECLYNDIPDSYKAACEMAAQMGTQQS